MLGKHGFTLTLSINGVDRTLHIAADRFVVGRAPHLTAAIPECNTISREHLEVFIKDEQIWIKDLGSSNGSYINDQKIIAQETVQYSGQVLRLGPSKLGVEIQITHDLIEKKSSNLERHAVDHELQQKNEELITTTNKIEELIQKETIYLKRVDGLIMHETDLAQQIKNLSAEIADQKLQIASLINDIADWDKQKQAAELMLLHHDATIDGMFRANEMESALIRDETLALEKTRARLKIEYDAAISEQKVKLEQYTTDHQILFSKMTLELEELKTHIEAKKRAQLELDQSIEHTQAKKIRQEAILAETMQDSEARLKAQTSKVNEQITELQSDFQQKSQHWNAQITGLQLDHSQLTQQLQLQQQESLKLKSAIEDNKKILEDLDLEKERMLSDSRLKCDQMEKNSADRCLDQINNAKAEAATLIDQAHKQVAALLKSEQEKLAQHHDEQMKNLRLSIAAEETRMRALLAGSQRELAQKIASQTLSLHTNEQHIPTQSLLHDLEKQILQSLTQQAGDLGITTNLKKNTQTFWVKACAGVAAVLLLFLSAVYGPSLLHKKIEVMKADNKKVSEDFMLGLREQRERMLKLDLQDRDEFQAQYVDNILYNPGYLAMKEDPTIQKQWTVQLSKFLFEELMFDDRKVVEFIPIETALIRILSDTNHILNKNNFEANLAKMKQSETAKAEEMWLVLGGKTNWEKLRKLEDKFYRDHADPSWSKQRSPTSTNP